MEQTATIATQSSAVCSPPSHTQVNAANYDSFLPRRDPLVKTVCKTFKHVRKDSIIAFLQLQKGSTAQAHQRAQSCWLSNSDIGGIVLSGMSTGHPASRLMLAAPEEADHTAAAVA